MIAFAPLWLVAALTLDFLLASGLHQPAPFQLVQEDADVPDEYRDRFYIDDEGHSFITDSGEFRVQTTASRVFLFNLWTGNGTTGLVKVCFPSAGASNSHCDENMCGFHLRVGTVVRLNNNPKLTMRNLNDTQYQFGLTRSFQLTLRSPFKHPLNLVLPSNCSVEFDHVTPEGAKLFRFTVEMELQDGQLEMASTQLVAPRPRFPEMTPSAPPMSRHVTPIAIRTLAIAVSPILFVICLVEVLVIACKRDRLSTSLPVQYVSRETGAIN